ncbi:hypothetical protein D030_3795B, partial [Vibrio parahaemolyticus AQ3810]
RRNFVLVGIEFVVKLNQSIFAVFTYIETNDDLRSTFH